MDDSYKLVLNDKIFEIPRNFELLRKISPTISDYLIKNPIYHVQSKVRNKTFQSFLNHLIKDTSLNINEANIWEYTLLNDEFGLIEKYLSSPEIEPLFNISNLLHPDYLPSLKNMKGYSFDKSSIEKHITQHLDKYIAETPNELSKIPLTSLGNIFYNKERCLKNQDLAYQFILNHQNLHFLIESLDAKLFKNIELLEDSVFKRNEHFGFCPQNSDKLVFYELQNKLKAANIKIQKLEEKNRQIINEKEKSTKKYQDLFDEKDKSIQNYENLFDNLRNELNSSNLKIINLEDQLKDSNQEIAKYKDKYQKISNEKDKSTKKYENLLDNLQNELNSSNKKIINLEDQLKDSNQEIAKYKDKYHKIFNEKDKSTKKYENLLDNLQNELNSSNKKIINLEDQLKDSNQEIAKYKEKYHKILNEKDKSTKKYENLLDNLQNELNSSNLKIIILEDQLKATNQEIQRLELDNKRKLNLIVDQKNLYLLENSKLLILQEKNKELELKLKEFQSSKQKDVNQDKTPNNIAPKNSNRPNRAASPDLRRIKKRFDLKPLNFPLPNFGQDKEINDIGNQAIIRQVPPNKSPPQNFKQEKPNNPIRKIKNQALLNEISPQNFKQEKPNNPIRKNKNQSPLNEISPQNLKKDERTNNQVTPNKFNPPPQILEQEERLNGPAQKRKKRSHKKRCDHKRENKNLSPKANVQEAQNQLVLDLNVLENNLF